MEAELLPSLQLRACRDPIGLASGLLEAGTANLQQSLEMRCPQNKLAPGNYGQKEKNQGRDETKDG